jgi:hypothetical protein
LHAYYKLNLASLSTYFIENICELTSLSRFVPLHFIQWNVGSICLSSKYLFWLLNKMLYVFSELSLGPLPTSLSLFHPPKNALCNKYSKVIFKFSTKQQKTSFSLKIFSIGNIFYKNILHGNKQSDHLLHLL